MRLAFWIRTRGRCDWQPTLTSMFLESVVPQLPWLDFRIVTPKSEYRDYVKHNPWTKRHLRLIPDSYRSGDVFQFILDSSDRYVFVIDDDLTLARRRDLKSTSQKGAYAEDKDVIDLLKRVRLWLKRGYVHGGISLRQNNHYSGEEVVKTNTRICGATFFDCDVINEEELRFDDLQARSDFHMWLSLLELGYENVCDYEFMVGHSRFKGMKRTETNSPGGCSVYRTPEFLIQEAKTLAELHPTVKLRYKKAKASESDAIQTEQGVPDVTVYWLKSVGTRDDRRSGIYDEEKIVAT